MTVWLLSPDTLSVLSSSAYKSLRPSESNTQEILDSDYFRDPELETDSEEDDNEGGGYDAEDNTTAGYSR